VKHVVSTPAPAQVVDGRQHTAGHGSESSDPCVDCALDACAWSRGLMFPASIAVINFIWHTHYGYALVFSGTVNALAIIFVLGRRPSRDSMLSCAALAMLAALSTALSMTFLMMWAPFEMEASATYFKMDQMAYDLMEGFPDSFDSDGLLKIFHRGGSSTYKVSQLSYEYQKHDHAGWVTFGLYMSYFPIVVVLDVVLAFKCLRAARVFAAASHKQILEMQSQLGRRLSRTTTEPPQPSSASVVPTGLGAAARVLQDVRQS
jgi:hypothetical protein